MADMITIHPVEPFTGRVLLQEFSPEHPGGVAFVASRDREVTVARTSLVQRLVDHKLVTVVTAKEAPVPAPDEPEEEGAEADEDVPMTPAQKAAQTRKQNADAKKGA